VTNWIKNSYWFSLSGQNVPNIKDLHDRYLVMWVFGRKKVLKNNLKKSKVENPPFPTQKQKGVWGGLGRNKEIKRNPWTLSYKSKEIKTYVLIRHLTETPLLPKQKKGDKYVR